MTITAKMIAKELGISPSAVSLALNGKSGVSEETRQNVIDKAAEMGYFQHRFGPQQRTSQTIRFVVYIGGKDVVNEIPFYSYVLRGAEIRAKELGYNVLVSYYNHADMVQQELDKLSLDVSGILFMGTELHREDLAPGFSFGKQPCPVIMIDNELFSEETNTVTTDNVRGARKAIQYLAEQGHRKIGYLSSLQRIPNFDSRCEGVNQAAGQYPDISIEKIPVNFATKKNVHDIMEWVNQAKDLPTALFADSDIIALGAIQALTRCGYRIPEDISVIGFDDMDASRLVNPPLTTIRVMKLEMGIAAVELLHKRIRNNHPELGTDAIYNVTITTRLKERKSVAALPF